MQEVSAKWLQVHNDNFLPLSYVKINYTVPDSTIESKGYSDSTYETSAFGDINWTGDIPADNNGEFIPHSVYTIYFNQDIESEKCGLSFVFDEAKNGYPLELELRVYLDNTQIEHNIYRNESVKRTLFINSKKFDKIEVEFVYWTDNSSFFPLAHIDSLNFIQQQSFVKKDILSLSAEQTIDLLSFSLPQSTLSYGLNNADGIYNPDNPQGIYKYLSQRQELEVLFGYEIDDTIQWISAGDYFLDSWDTPQNGIAASFQAKSGIEFMGAEFDNGLFGSSEYNWAEYISSSNGYIDTQIIFSNYSDALYTIRLDFMLNSLSNGTIFGISNGTDKLICEVINNNIRITYNNIYKDIYAVSTNKRYTIEITFDTGYEYKHLHYELFDTNNLLVIGWFDELGDITGGFPDLPLFIGALNLNGTATSNANMRIYPVVNIYKYENDNIEYIFSGMPSQDNTDGTFGLLSLGYFYEGVGTYTANVYSGVTTLYDLAINAFKQSQIPLNDNNTTRYEQYLSDELKKYPVALPNDFKHSNAEVVQLCANAAKCIWYWDRQGQSHIEPLNVYENKLSNDYRYVEYIGMEGQYHSQGIGSFGSTYFLTNIKMTIDTVMRIKFMVDSGSGHSDIIGVSDGNEAFTLYTQTDGNIRFALIKGSNIDFAVCPIEYGKVYYFEIGNAYVKDLTTQNILASASPAPNNTEFENYIRFFRFEDFRGKIYEAEILQNGKTVGKFLPARKTNDNLVYGDIYPNPYFFNIVDNTYIEQTENIGWQSSATIGADILTNNNSFDMIDLPNGYTQVEYIESDGTATLEINQQGIIIDFNDYILNIDYSILTNENQDVIRHNNNEYALNIANGSVRYLPNTNVLFANHTLFQRYKEKFDFITDISSQLDYYINVYGDYSFPHYSVTYGDTNKILLFNNGRQRIYHLSWLTFNNIPILNLIPCVRNVDSVAGFYDIVHNTFYTTSGLTAGKSVMKAPYNIDRFVSYKNGEYNLLKELKSVDVNNGQAIYEVDSKGTVQSVSNPLIQNDIQAMQVAEWVAKTLQLRKNISGDFRPDVRLDVLDDVDIENKFANSNALITEVKYTYNGAFRGTYSAKVKG